MKIHIIREIDEVTRRQKMIQFLAMREAFTSPGKVVYITLNRRKIHELEHTFSEFANKSIWLPEFRTLRGYYDEYLLYTNPHIFFIHTQEKKILWTDLIRDTELKDSEKEKLESILEDLLEFDHFCSLYGIGLPDRIAFFRQSFSLIADPYKQVWNAYQEKLNELSAIDYEEAPWAFKKEKIQSVKRKSARILVLDGLYWLYPYQKRILEHILPQFEEVVWIENPAVHPAQWRKSSERNIPEEIAGTLDSQETDRYVSSIRSTFRDKIFNSEANGRADFHVLKAPSMSGEVLDIARYIFYLFKEKGIKPEDITLVYNHPGYLPYIENTFRYMGIPYDIARGKNINEIPLIGNWLKLLTLKLNGFPVKDTLNLISRFFGDHSPIPFHSKEIKVLKEWFQFSDVSFIINLNREFHFKKWFEKISGWTSMAEFLPSSWVYDEKIKDEIPDLLEQAYRKLMQWLQWFPKNQTISFEEWIRWIEESFTVILTGYPEDETDQKWKEYFDKIRYQFLRYQKRIGFNQRDYNEWLKILLDMVRELEYRDVGQEGIRCLEKLEARDLTGTYLIVLGNCKQYFPAEIKYPGFFKELITSLKERESSPSFFSSFKESLYLLYNYSMNFTHLLFTYPGRVGEEFTGLSPVLLLETGKVLFQDQPLDEHLDFERQIVEYFNRKSEMIRQSMNRIPEFRVKIQSKELSNMFNIEVKMPVIRSRTEMKINVSSVYDGLIGVNREWKTELMHFYKEADQISWSPSRFETLLTCPQKYWYRYWLHLEVSENLQEGLDSRMIGRIFHLALRFIFSNPDFIKKLKSRSGPEEMADLFKDGFQQAFQTVIETFKSVNSYFEYVVKGIRRKLVKQNYITKLFEVEYNRLNLQQEGILRFITEEEFKGNLILSDGMSFTLTGRIDRVDVGEQHVYFYDYKYTSNGKRYLRQLQDGLYWQLIFYYFLLKQYFPDHFILGAVYPVKEIKKVPIDTKFEHFFGSISELENELKMRIAEVISIYTQAHFYTGILEEKKMYCSNCEFRTICNRKKTFVRADSGKNQIIDAPLKEQSWFGSVNGKKWIPKPLDDSWFQGS
jgi:hypothetical protein